MLTNDYQSIAALPAGLAVRARPGRARRSPFEWGDELRGVLTVGYARPHHVSQDDLALLETFAELAAAACRNASAHAATRQAARTDGLTGCLNHAALHESLPREIERAARGAAATLSLVLIDLDDFKQVNEEHGHLAGDEVLRRVGHALRGGIRPYDIAARYGGDEFALLAVERRRGAGAARSPRARSRASRPRSPSSSRAARAARPPASPSGSPGSPPPQLIARADRALLHGKQAGGRGEANPFSAVPEPESPRPLRARYGARSRRPPCRPRPGPTPATRRRAPAQAHAPARRSPTRSARGSSAMTDVGEILEAAVDELHRAFGYYLCAAVRLRPTATSSAPPCAATRSCALGDRRAGASRARPG